MSKMPRISVFMLTIMIASCGVWAQNPGTDKSKDPKDEFINLDFSFFNLFSDLITKDDKFDKDSVTISVSFLDKNGNQQLLKPALIRKLGENKKTADVKIPLNEFIGKNLQKLRITKGQGAQVLVTAHLDKNLGSKISAIADLKDGPKTIKISPYSHIVSLLLTESKQGFGLTNKIDPDNLAEKVTKAQKDWASVFKKMSSSDFPTVVHLMNTFLWGSLENDKDIWSSIEKIVKETFGSAGLTSVEKVLNDQIKEIRLNQTSLLNSTKRLVAENFLGGFSKRIVGSSKKFLVNTFEQTEDQEIDGNCRDKNGECSLIAAVSELDATDKSIFVVIEVPKGEFEISKTLTLSRNFSIIGLDKEATTLKLKPDFSGRHLEATADVNDARISNLKFVGIHDGSTYQSSAGGISFLGEDPDGSLIVVNSIFKNNHSSRGGAIYLQSGGIEISGCTFENNVSPSGGALELNMQNDSKIKDTVFIENIAASSGGGAIAVNRIFLSDPEKKDIVLRIENSNFKANRSSAFRGGAIYLNTVNVRTEIDQSSFEGNYSMWRGATIKSNEYLLIKNSSFTENESPYGGLFFHSSAHEMIMENCVIAGNSTNGILKVDALSDKPVTVRNSTIISDTSPHGPSKTSTIIYQNSIIQGDYNCGSQTQTERIQSLGGNIFSKACEYVSLIDKVFDGENFLERKTLSDGRAYYPLAPESPAHNFGIGGCLALDIVGKTRAKKCDSGAYEN